MRRITILITGLTLFFAFSAPSGEVVSRRLSGWFDVVTPDGWTGRRYMDGADVVAEEFDSDGDRRFDVWRFYRRGLLSSEERDLTGNGRVDFQSFWDSRRFRLVSVLRDTSARGVNDLEIESAGRNRWEIREDRNHDGVADRILIVDGPPDLFERLGMDLARQPDVIDGIPAEYWRELRTDDAHTRFITEYRRYSRGVLVQYGVWDGGGVAWRRVPPDFTPPAPAAPAAPAIVPPSPSVPAGPSAEPFVPPFDGASAYPEPDGLRVPAAVDRTRYDGLPPGESGARSLPARMRPPGVSG